MFPMLVKQRSDFQRFCSIFILFLIIIFVMNCDNTKMFIPDDIMSQPFYSGIFIFCAPGLAILFERIILFIEECRYSKGKWRDHLLLCFDNCYKFIICAMLLIILYVLYMYNISEGLYVPVRLLWIFLVAVFLASLNMLFDYDKDIINKTFDDEKSIGWSWAYGAFRYYYEICFEGDPSSLTSISILKRMENFEREHKIKLFVKRLVVICPLSCDVDGLLSARDPAVHLVGRLESVFNDQGGNVNRDYHNSVYKIGDKNPIYAVVEFPNSLKCFKKEGDEQINEEMRRYHRDCFIKHLKRFLEDKPCLFLRYDDKNSKESLSDFLANELHKYVQESKSSKFIAISEKDI